MNNTASATFTSATDFMVVPGMVAPMWVQPNPDNPTHNGMLAAHLGAMGPFATREEAVAVAVAEGFFDFDRVVLERRTRVRV
jgi:hypothetical protein